MTIQVLNIQASGRTDESLTRQLSAEVLSTFKDPQVINRDLSDGISFVNQSWINANFTAFGDRTNEQNTDLLYSDTLVNELENADVLLIGAPIYNFGVPAVLKAWIDMIVRVGRTFTYTSTGPVGLLKEKKAIVVMASGGTTVGSDIDFASGYLRHVLEFVGIGDTTFIAADALGEGSDEKLKAARTTIAAL